MNDRICHLCGTWKTAEEMATGERCIACNERLDQSTDPLHLSRSSDPWTSKAAAHSVNLGPEKRAALDLVVKWPGHTARELDTKRGTNEGSVRKRLNDLHNDGIIHKGEPRRCKVTGRMAQTWYADKPPTSNTDIWGEPV